MAKKFSYEYITSTASVVVNAGQGDGIVTHIVNDSKKNEYARVLIYQNTGAGAIIAYDSGVADIVPSWQWGLGFTVPQSGDYWLRIQISSESLIAKVSFERLQNGIWVPFVSYLPGDFAIFKTIPSRKRLWG
jgi:hypothetical protein